MLSSGFCFPFDLCVDTLIAKSEGESETLGNHDNVPLRDLEVAGPSISERGHLNHVLGDGLRPTMTSLVGVSKAMTLYGSVGWDSVPRGSGDIARMVYRVRFRNVTGGSSS